jgi:hypothetical protein
MESHTKARDIYKKGTEKKTGMQIPGFWDVKHYNLVERHKRFA